MNQKFPFPPHPTCFLSSCYSTNKLLKSCASNLTQCVFPKKRFIKLQLKSQTLMYNTKITKKKKKRQHVIDQLWRLWDCPGVATCSSNDDVSQAGQFLQLFPRCAPVRNGHRRIAWKQTISKKGRIQLSFSNGLRFSLCLLKPRMNYECLTIHQ